MRNWCSFQAKSSESKDHMPWKIFKENRDWCSGIKRLLLSDFGNKKWLQPQWLSQNLLAGVEGLEPSRTVLETGMLPLHHTPKERLFNYRHGVLETTALPAELYPLIWTLIYYTLEKAFCQVGFHISFDAIVNLHSFGKFHKILYWQ